MTENGLSLRQASLELRRTDSLADVATSRLRFLLLDTSYSMVEYAGEKRKIDALRDIVRELRENYQLDFRQIVFGEEVSIREDIPEPSGGTPMHRAFQLAREHNATKVVVVSDGLPDSPVDAYHEAITLGCKIDCFYVGPIPHRGQEFLREIATATGGKYAQGSLGEAKALTEGLRRAIAALPPAIELGEGSA